MQCQAITKSNTQCQRNSQSNSQYCWQHQPQESKTSVIAEALQPAILGQINLYTGHILPLSKKFSEEINRREILKNWLTQIHSQTPFDQIKSTEIPILWILYQKRINNAPAVNLLDKAIKKGLNRDIFFSHFFYYTEDKADWWPLSWLNIEEQPKKYLKLINKKLAGYIKKNKVRYGDVVSFHYIYQNEDEKGAYMFYNGKKLIYPYYDIGAGIIPKEMPINNFPTTIYFRDVLPSDEGELDYVWFNRTNTKYQLIQEHKNKSLVLSHYLITGAGVDYEIWVEGSLVEENWTGIHLLYSASFKDYVKGLLRLEESLINLIESSQSSTLLFEI